jgi:hypothetical protein
MGIGDLRSIPREPGHQGRRAGEHHPDAHINTSRPKKSGIEGSNKRTRNVQRKVELEAFPGAPCRPPVLAELLDSPVGK